MKVKWKNLLCYLFAMVFIVVAIIAVTTAVEEQVFSGYTTGAPDYDPIFKTIVIYPYQSGGILCAFIGVVLTMIALFVDFEEKEENKSEWESPLLQNS